MSVHRKLRCKFLGIQEFGLQRVYLWGTGAKQVQAEGKEQGTVGVCRTCP